MLVNMLLFIHCITDGNGCLGIQVLQFAKASLWKAKLLKSLACEECFLLANQEPPHQAQETVTLTGLL